MTAMRKYKHIIFDIDAISQLSKLRNEYMADSPNWLILNFYCINLLKFVGYSTDFH